MNPNLNTFCGAIRDFEGTPSDLNYQNNNPGNCRCSPVGYLAKYGNVLCVETASGKFAKFPTYYLGWEYLQNLVMFRAECHPTWTILNFFQGVLVNGVYEGGYSPASDNNPSVKYATFVATRCGVSVETTLSQLLT